MKKNDNYWAQRAFHATKMDYFRKLSEYQPEHIVKLIEVDVLAPEIKKTDKAAFFEANKLLLACYVDTGEAEKAKTLINLINENFNKIAGMELFLFYKAIEEEQETFEDHPEYRESFRKILYECFEEVASSDPSRNKDTWEKVTKLLEPQDELLFSDDDYIEALGQGSDVKDSQEV